MIIFFQCGMLLPPGSQKTVYAAGDRAQPGMLSHEYGREIILKKVNRASATGSGHRLTLKNFNI